MSAIGDSKVTQKASSSSSSNSRAAEPKGKEKVKNVVEKTKPFQWTQQLREELIKKYNDPKYLLDSPQRKHNISLISKHLKIPLKVCSSQIQVLKNRGDIKEQELDSEDEKVDEMEATELEILPRIPFFLSDEDVEAELNEIENSAINPFYSYFAK